MKFLDVLLPIGSGYDFAAVALNASVTTGVPNVFFKLGQSHVRLLATVPRARKLLRFSKHGGARNRFIFCTRGSTRRTFERMGQGSQTPRAVLVAAFRQHRFVDDYT